MRYKIVKKYDVSNYKWVQDEKTLLEIIEEAISLLDHTEDNFEDQFEVYDDTCKKLNLKTQKYLTIGEDMRIVLDG